MISSDTTTEPRFVLFAARDGERVVAGLTNLERLVETALHAGMNDILVIAAEPTAAERSLVGRVGRRGRLTAVAPGSSAEKEALSAIHDAGGSFVLAHTGVAVDPRYFERFLAVPTEPGRVLIAVTVGVPSSHPLAPPLTLKTGFLLPHGGKAPDGPVHWLGIARLPTSCSHILAGGVVAAGDALRLLLDESTGSDRLRATLAPPGFAALVLSERERDEAVRGMLATVGKESDGLVARHLNRHISRRITTLLVDSRVSPNHVTAALLAIGVGTGFVIARGSHATFLLGTMLYQINSTLDGVDGELARVRFETTRWGAKADTVSDLVGNTLLFVAVPVGVTRMNPGHAIYAVLGWLIALGMVVLPIGVAIRTRGASFGDYGPSLVRSVRNRWHPLLTRIFVFATQIARRDSYALLFFVLSLLGQDPLVLWCLAGGIVGHLATLALRPEPRSTT